VLLLLHKLSSAAAMENASSPQPGPSGAGSPMSASQRAQQQTLLAKQTIVDEWNVKEKLLLAQLVKPNGDQNWVSVSRMVKQAADAEGMDRPLDWFSQKNCAQQFNKLLEEHESQAGTSGRRKRGEGAASTESVYKAIQEKLRQARIKELEVEVKERLERMDQYEEEVRLLDDPNTPDEVIDEIEKKEEEDVKRDKELARLKEEHLKAREERLKQLQLAQKMLPVTRKDPGKGSGSGAKKVEESPGSPAKANVEGKKSSQLSAGSALTPTVDAVKEEAGKAGGGADVDKKKEGEADSKAEKKKPEEPAKEAPANEEEKTPSSSARKRPLRPTRGSAASKEEDRLPPPTSIPRSKRTSEKSDEGVGGDEDQSPLSHTRGRASRGRRGGDDEHDAAENRRVRHLRGATPAGEVDGGSGRGRRGSGATSRSSSPAGSDKQELAEGPQETPVAATPVRATRRGKRTSERQAAAASAADFFYESAPNSPASGVGAGDDEASMKAFKKQGTMMLDNLRNHRFSHQFSQPVALAGEDAVVACQRRHVRPPPRSLSEYAKVIRFPGDLAGIKRAIETAALRNVDEMERSVARMLFNAVMFNQHRAEVRAKAYSDRPSRRRNFPVPARQPRQKDVQGRQVHLLAASPHARSGQGRGHEVLFRPLHKDSPRPTAPYGGGGRCRRTQESGCGSHLRRWWVQQEEEEVDDYIHCQIHKRTNKRCSQLLPQALK